MKQELKFTAFLIACYIALDLAIAVSQQFITAPPYSNALVAGIEGFAIGAMFAQIVIAAIWSGLSPSKTLLRTLIGASVLVAVAVGISAFVNTFTPRVNFVRQSWGADRYTWLVFVFLYALVQMLLMLHRRWKGYWLSTPQLEMNQIRKRTFSLAELFLFPVFFCVPLIVLPALLDSLSPAIAAMCVTALLLACVFYAAIHLLAFLRRRVSIVWLAVLLLFCPLILLPASFVITGTVNGSIFGVPFVSILLFVHFGALAIGIPTAVFARSVGYRIRGSKLAT